MTSDELFERFKNDKDFLVYMLVLALKGELMAVPTNDQMSRDQKMRLIEMAEAIIN